MTKHTASIPLVKFNSKSSVSTGKLISRDGWMCSYCGKFLTLDMMTVDHVIPTLRGGPDTPENTVISCIECNAQKGDMNLIEYLHYLTIRRWLEESAPHEVHPVAPPIIAIEGKRPTEFIPLSWWLDVEKLLLEWRESWHQSGAIIVTMTLADRVSEVAFLSGPLFDYYRWKQGNGQRQ